MRLAFNKQHSSLSLDCQLIQLFRKKYFAFMQFSKVKHRKVDVKKLHVLRS